jgi:hypothetical protein
VELNKRDAVAQNFLAALRALKFAKRGAANLRDLLLL